MNTLNISDIILLANYFNVHTISNLNKIIESYNVGTMTPEKAWKIHKGKLIDKFKTDDSAPKDAFSLPQEFIEADPTIEKTYLEWIILSYLRGGIKKFEDIASRTGPALQKYEYLKDKHLKDKHLKLQPILQFYGIVGCKKVIKKGKMEDKEMQIPGLENYLDEFKDELKKFEIEYKVETKEYEKLVDNDEVLIVHPLTEQASRTYGKHTKWCVSADKGNMFESYNKNGPLYMFIPKKEQHASEKYAIHINTKSFMDEKDDLIELVWLFQTRFSDLLKAKDKTSKEYKFIKKLRKESTDKYFNLLFVPEDERTREIELEAVKQHIWALKYISDKEIVLEVVKQNGLALEYASEELRNNKDIVLVAVEQHGSALQYASKNLRKNKDIVLAAVEQEWHALEFASEELQNNKDIVLTAIEQDGYALEYASEELRNNKKIVLAAVKHSGYVLDYASEKLQNNKDIVFAAVKKNGRALKFANKALQSDKDIVLAAIEQDGNALEYASNELRNNKDIVLAAVKQDGDALDYAREELRNNKDIVLAAMEQNVNAYNVAGSKIQFDKEILDLYNAMKK